MDAPAHFTKGGNRVDEIPFSNLIGPGVKIDISEKARSVTILWIMDSTTVLVYLFD